MPDSSTGNPSLSVDDAHNSGESAEVRKASPKAGKTRATTRATKLPDVTGRLAPRLPHERDESSDSTSRAPSETMRRAHDDVVSGQRNTGKGEVTDAVYRRNLRGRTPGADRD